MNILLAAENISLLRSGETSIPWYYIREFTRAGHQVSVICHARVRSEIASSFDLDACELIEYVEDTWLQRALFRIGKTFPYRIEDLIFGQLIQSFTQIRMRRVAHQVVTSKPIDVVFQPIPISPRVPSFLYGLGVPVVIGPMCGDLELPPAFRHMDGAVVNGAIQIGRCVSSLLHSVIPGKLCAAALLVGNQRTARALPKRTRALIFEVVESGVDLERWEPKDYFGQQTSGLVRYVFCGRLVDWKGCQYLVQAFLPLARAGTAHLDIIGDGELIQEISRQVEVSGIGHAVTIHGRLSLEDTIALMRDSDVYVMPSLRECGGLALLEAMCLGLPIIAANWMGPAEYLTQECAILVDVGSESEFVFGLTEAMKKLAASQDLRREMGVAARQRVFAGEFGWRKKAQRVLDVMGVVVGGR